MKSRRIGMLVVALGLGLAAAAQAQVLCARTTSRGETKFRIREACRAREVERAPAAGFVHLLEPPPPVTGFVQETAVPAPVPGFVQETAPPRTRVFAFESFWRTNVGLEGAEVMIDGVATSVQVPTTADSTDLVVTFHAECANFAGASWIDVDVKVDGTALGSTAQSPSVGDDAFCADEKWGTHSVTVVARGVGPGDHTLSVDAALHDFGGAEGIGTIDDTGLTVIAVPN